MNKILQHKKEIIISLITGVFLFYIQPLLEFLGKGFIKICISVSDKFSNSYYKSIAKNDLSAFSEWNSFILNYLMIIAFIVFILYIKNKKRNLQRLADKNLRKISASKERLLEIGKEPNTAPSKEEILKEKDELLAEITRLEQDASDIKDKAYKRDNRLIFVSIMTIFLFFTLFTNYFTLTSIASKNLDFKNDITKLIPYTNDSLIHRINSDWARIENSTDFIHIRSKIDSLKKHHHIK